MASWVVEKDRYPFWSGRHCSRFETVSYYLCFFTTGVIIICNFIMGYNDVKKWGGHERI